MIGGVQGGSVYGSQITRQGRFGYRFEPRHRIGDRQSDAAEGWRVMLSARSAEQLREMEEALRDSGAEVAAHAADVGTPDGADRLIEVTVAAYRGIAILVNNVGVAGVARIADSSDVDWRGSPR